MRERHFPSKATRIHSAHLNTIFNLSQRRADSVKSYLVQAMGINPAQIQTHGYGATKFRASANGSIEEQSPNRRVEVVVRTTEG